MPVQVGGESSDVAALTSLAGARSPPHRGAHGLLARLCCPLCPSNTELVVESGPELFCTECESRYPVVTCGTEWIPWLFRRPDIARIEWSARLKGFLHQNTIEHNRLNRALDRSLSGQSTQRRLQTTMQAHREHRKQILALLEPLGLDGDVLVPGITKTLHDKLPKNQALTSYASNVFRDWAWKNDENEMLLDAVDEVLRADRRDSLGSVLTLGAGACRLSYDLHQKYAPELSVVLDFNPLLLLIGCRVIGGDVLALYEFPQPGIGDDGCGVLQHCQAPARLSDGTAFSFVLGDATNPPFKPGSFDTVVTPWLIDIIPQDLKAFLPQLNRLLPIDGVWVNSGTLAFYHENPQRCYGEDEVLEIVEQNGFQVDRIDYRRVPYLQSPHSAHGRVERIVSFVARKVVDVETPPAPAQLPEWLLDASLPIPTSSDRVVESSSYLLAAQIMAAIDGKRSILSIAQMVSREYSLGLEECVMAVTRVLVDKYEDGNSSQLFL